MSSDISCKDGASTKSNDGVCEVNDMLPNMSTTDDREVIVSVCANCGKEGSEVTNTCNKCNSVMYCNAACKKKHRHKHKKDCERRVAELHDEALFKQPPTEEDCPICFLRMPYLIPAQMYMSCCGKVICCGCIHAVALRDDLCPFCRTPTPFTDEEMINRYKKRMELKDDPIAIYNIGNFYADGSHGYPQNYIKSKELYHRAGELGCAAAYNNLGNAYCNGRGMERDEREGKHYYELSAMSGNVYARHNLGDLEMKAGNMGRALRHWIISIEGGFKVSLESIKRSYKMGNATKDDYANALRSYQIYQLIILT